MRNEKFKGYETSYVESLLKIAGEDVQDNSLIEEGDYLGLAIKACEKFNNDYEGDFFDNGDIQQ